MEMNEYQKLAYRTASDKVKEDPILNAALGLTGESGECADMVKKNRFQGHPLNVDKLVKELGDVLWYIAGMATGLGLNLNEVAEINIRKLKNRYPDGFDVEKSINREESQNENN